MIRQVVSLLVACNCVLAAIMLAPAAAQQRKPVRIVAFGDSLSAGYQLAQAEAFPVQLETRLKAKGLQVEVINASVSGDTTAAALERVQWAIPDDVDAVIVELGANDALRGLDPVRSKANLDAIITPLRAKGIEVLLAGMPAPGNFGADYARTFEAMYRELATKHDLIFYPFFLDGVALDTSLNLRDGMHPNAKGVAVIVNNILPSVEQLIARVAAKSKPATGAAQGPTKG